MYFKGLFSKKISYKQGMQLLLNHCNDNGYDDKTMLWKDTTHRKHLFGYHKKSNRLVSNNWISYHPTRQNQKYTVWIDLVSEEITEILR